MKGDQITVQPEKVTSIIKYCRSVCYDYTLEVEVLSNTIKIKIVDYGN